MKVLLIFIFCKILFYLKNRQIKYRGQMIFSLSRFVMPTTSGIVVETLTKVVTIPTKWKNLLIYNICIENKNDVSLPWSSLRASVNVFKATEVAFYAVYWKATHFFLPLVYLYKMEFQGCFLLIGKDKD